MSDRRAAPLLAAGLLLPVCLIYLWYPGDADQTLFELGAMRLSAGAVYYRDFWDIKQPGIYWVYQLGALLGVGVVGPRLLEIAGGAFGAWAVWSLSGRWAPHLVARVVSPVLVIGAYLISTHHGGVVVVEGLTTSLLVVVVALVWPRDPAGGSPQSVWRWVVAGVLAGVVGVLKILYLPLPGMFLFGGLVVSRATMWGRVRLAGAALVGASVPLAVMSGYFVLYGVWRLFWVTTFGIPFDTVVQPIMGSGRHRYVELAIGQGALLLPLAVVAFVTVARRRTWCREVTLVATFLVALALAWPQFPTPYRLLILVAPLGLLAMVGLNVVLVRADARAERGWVARAGVRRSRRRARAGVLAVLALLSLPLMRGPQRLVFAAPWVPSWGLGLAGRDARDEVLIHESASADVAPVRGLVRPGDSVYVVGHPQLYQLLCAREAIEISGWGSALQPADVWRERDRQLVRSRPAWVFVETEMSRTVSLMAPRFWLLLARSYRRVAVAPRGVWYWTDRPGEPAGVPGDNRLSD